MTTSAEEIRCPNPTRTPHPMRVVEELTAWEGHSADAVQAMLDSLARLREEGLDVIED